MNVRKLILTIVATCALLPGTEAATSYRDYHEKVVPKPADRRRVGVSVRLDRDAVERGSYETRLLQSLILARMWDVPSMEFIPRMFFNEDASLLAQLRALDVDDVIELDIRRLKLPASQAPTKGKRPERRYVIDASLRILNVRTGNVTAETTLEKLILPDIGAYTEELDGQTATFMSLATHMVAFYEGQAAAVALTPTCTAIEGAVDAERAGRHEDAALILSEIVRRDPSREAELRDRRDLALMRAGRTAGLEQAGEGAVDAGGSTPRSGIDFLAPENKGKMFPVSQGHMPVRQNLQVKSFAFSVGVLMKDASARGGILIGSKTRNIYVTIAPADGRQSPRIIVETVNSVTGIADTREYKMQPEQHGLNRLNRLEIRYDTGDLKVSMDGNQIFTVPRVILTQPSLFVFGKLSTVYFQDARLNY